MGVPVTPGRECLSSGSVLRLRKPAVLVGQPGPGEVNGGGPARRRSVDGDAIGDCLGNGEDGADLNDGPGSEALVSDGRAYL
jgi:hypothetical protein